MEGSDYHRPVARLDASSSTAASPDPSACDEGPEPHNPSLDEPWELSAANALMRLYDLGDARTALQSPFSDEFRERLSRLEPHSHAAADAGKEPLGGADGQGLETRLAGITSEIQQALAAFRADHSLQPLRQRFDHFEKRFEAALANVATRTDVEGLKLVEAHVSELFERADAAKEQLSRLVVVEAQLAGLKTNLSDERMARLASALAPSQQELARIATAAAETVVQRFAGQPSAHSDGGKTDALLTSFIEERRRSEQLAGEALETMQQAMQHILDRLDSIEMTQAALVDGRGSSEGDHDPRGQDAIYGAASPMAATVARAQDDADSARQTARVQQPVEDLTLADLGLGASVPQQSRGGESGGANLAGAAVRIFGSAP